MINSKRMSKPETRNPHPGPLPSDGRGRIVPRAAADPTALETANNGSGCSLSRRTGEGQGEGRFVPTGLLSGSYFCASPKSKALTFRQTNSFRGFAIAVQVRQRNVDCTKGVGRKTHKKVSALQPRHHFLRQHFIRGRAG